MSIQLMKGHYMNFILNALAGRNPDSYYDVHKKFIDGWLKQWRATHPLSPVKVYRGVILDPKEVEKWGGKLPPLEHIRYISFSEDKEIAEVFADMLNPMAQFFRAKHPKHEGYLIEHTADLSEILFHHAWTKELEIVKYFGEETRHVYEQKEVMLANTFMTFNLIPVKRGQSKMKGIAP